MPDEQPTRTDTERKAAQARRERAAGRRQVSMYLPGDLLSWIEARARTLGESRAEQIEKMLRERQRQT